MPDQENNNINNQQQTNQIDEWHNPVDGQELFNELVTTYSRYLSLQTYQAETLSLWTIFSYCIDANNIAPKLLIHSPEKRCGKTLLLDILSELVCKPLMASNITPAVIFRLINETKHTILIDEADTFINNNQELVGIINSGHRKKSAFVWRCNADTHQPQQFSTWTPMVIAMIGKPKDTIIDRSIVITMQRKKPDDVVERFILSRVEEHLNNLTIRIKKWVKDNFDDLSNADPSMPDSPNDRATDNWRPLIAIADLIGIECGILSRTAFIEMNTTSEDDDTTSTSIKLLAELKNAFATTRRDRISTQEFLDSLISDEDAPWVDWNRGRQITPTQIAKHLRPFNICPKKIRFGDYTTRGYDIADCTEAFTRYLNGTVEQEIDESVVECSVVPCVPRDPFDALFDD